MIEKFLKFANVLVDNLFETTHCKINYSQNNIFWVLLNTEKSETFKEGKQ